MLSRPVWKSHCRVERVDESTVLLLHEKDYLLLRGRAFPLLVPLLDGRHSLPEVFSALSSRLSLVEVSQALEVAAEQGCILEGGADTPEEAPFWHELGVDMGTVAECLQTPVSVLCLGGAWEERQREALRAQGLRTEGEAGFQLVLCDDYLHPALDALNRQALAARRPWMLARPVGGTLWLGPVFRPTLTACWACLAQRLRSNRQLESFLEQEQGRVQPLVLPAASLSASTGAAFQLAALEVAKALVLGPEHPLGEQLVTLDLTTLELERHALVRRPQCPVCSGEEAASRAPLPVIPRPCPKRFEGDGGHRTQSPEETLARLEKHVSPITGVVRNLEALGSDGGAGLVHSYAAGHNFALMQQDLRFVLLNLRGRSGGKGTTDTQAKVSALCEAIERYSGVYRDEEWSLVTSLHELRDDAIHPNALMNFSPTQYARRAEWNAAHPSGFHHVPEAFDPDRRIHWTSAWSLTHERFRHVPSAYCAFGHPDLGKWFFCTSDSNGCAAGNTLEEAILQGFLELVERDSVALWWYSRTRRPAVDLDSVDLPYVHALREHYRRLQRELWVLDVTADLGIPTLAAVSRRHDSPVEDIVVGFGAHLDARVALLRALTEVNQFLPAVQQRDAQGQTLYWFPEREAVNWWRMATVENQPYLCPDPSVTARRLGALPDLSSGDLKVDVERCVAHARRAGLETLVVDQTQPDVGLPVVKVMVPGLRHFWKRFGPGRLYDVPARLGWVPLPLREEQLNPTGIFF